MKTLCRFICCITQTAVAAEKAARSPSVPCCCCCGIKCNIDITNCLDHYDNNVHPEHDVQMAGQNAPTQVVME